MLILTRKRDESIVIDDNIKIKILEIDNNRVQLGIEAPENIIVHREEIYQEIQEENKLAAGMKKEISTDMSNLLKTRLKKKKNRDKRSKRI
ncbi:carbon storage regulator CsrA [Orenia marismortui]|uniref:Translational regulator CsrA n=1 Tax=Orenia marismortui TaxID=46469 RepID=A0A4R8HFN2_9FIRM|nr:carbon storage regulator CsrA [Orenia marismortui]TDX58900.1 carbon storage regulator CsrA [Orenia marismortui]